MKLKQWILAKLQEWKREQRIKQLPWTCQHCELLGICRDEQNGWKCRHGCMILNAERKKNV